MICDRYSKIGISYYSLVIVLFLQFVPIPGLSQDVSSKQKIEFNFSIGCSVQFFALEQFLLKPTIPRYEGSFFLAGLGNEEGFGIPIAFKAYDPRWRLGIIYEPIIRYDIVDVNPKGPYIFGVFADHHFSVYHKFNFTSQLLPHTVKKPVPMYFGTGYSMISHGQSYDFNWLLYDKQTQTVIKGTRVDLSLNGIHAMIGINIYKRFYLEAKFIHIPQNQIIYKLYQSANMLIIKGAYQIPVLKRKKA